MLKSLLCRSKNSTTVIQPHRGSPPMLDLNQSDHEDDGFLLVGQTRSEQTTVKADDVSHDAPPDYHALINNSGAKGIDNSPPPAYLPDQPNDGGMPHMSVNTHAVSPISLNAHDMYLPFQYPSSQPVSELPSLSCTNTDLNPADRIYDQPFIYTDNSLKNSTSHALDDMDTRPSNDELIQGMSFRISPRLESLVLGRAGFYCDMMHGAQSVSNYTYDFSLEKSLLKNEQADYQYHTGDW